MLHAIDTDVFTAVMYGKASVVARLEAIPVEDQSIPVVVLEEILRGRLNAIRLAESGKDRTSLEVAYDLFRRSVIDSKSYRILKYSTEATDRVNEWKRQKIRVGTLDMRIAAIAVVHGARLVTMNRQDFRRLPGLDVEYWT
jgi:tRNA(fMet)-specific endonuclease VapC